MSSKRTFNDIKDFDDEDNLDDEYGQKENKYEHSINATLFLIDARKKMFSSHFDKETSAILACLKCVRNAMRKKIFSEEKCYIGIILLGTKKKNNSLNLNSITVLRDLSLLGADHILKVDEVIKALENSTYENDFGFNNFSLGDAFWLSTHMFYERPQKLNKSLLLFTNDDNPVSDEKNDKNRAMASAQDMYKNFIIYDHIHLGEDYDANKFYKKLLQASHHDINYTIPDPVATIKEMEKRANQLNFKYLTLVKLPFVIGKDFKIGVSVHFLVRKIKIPPKVKLSKSTNEKVFTKMQLFETETGSLVNDEDVKKCQIVGQKEISFYLSELKIVSDFGNAEIRLLGFKPASIIGLENFVRPCAFIYPDETTYKGSSLFFTGLLKCCIEKQVVPICTMSMRTTSANRFVALIAQNNNSCTDKEKFFPQGFIVFFLPFVEEIRSFEDNKVKRADSEQVNIAKKLIKKLKFKYKVDQFQNPKLQNHWAAIEALALDLEEPESVNDNTCPNYELISQRTGKIAQEFIEAVYPDDYDPEVWGAPKKAASSLTSKSEMKINVDNVEKLIKKGKGVTLANDVLKAYLKSIGKGKGLSKVTKSDLLEKAQKHLNLI